MSLAGIDGFSRAERANRPPYITRRFKELRRGKINNETKKFKRRGSKSGILWRLIKITRNGYVWGENEKFIKAQFGADEVESADVTTSESSH